MIRLPGLAAILLLGIGAVILVPHRVRTALHGPPSRGTALSFALLLLFLTALFIVIIKVGWTRFPLLWGPEIQ